MNRISQHLADLHPFFKGIRTTLKALMEQRNTSNNVKNRDKVVPGSEEKNHNREGSSDPQVDLNKRLRDQDWFD